MSTYKENKMTQDYVEDLQDAVESIQKVLNRDTTNLGQIEKDLLEATLEKLREELQFYNR